MAMRPAGELEALDGARIFPSKQPPHGFKVTCCFGPCRVSIRQWARANAGPFHLGPKAMVLTL